MLSSGIAFVGLLHDRVLHALQRHPVDGGAGEARRSLLIPPRGRCLKIEELSRFLILIKSNF